MVQRLLEARELVVKALTDLGLLLAALATAAGVWWGVARNRRDHIEADDAAQERLLKLIEEEADKRVQIVRTEFELAIAMMRLDHANELTKMRADFERQIATVKADGERYRCDVAERCDGRVLDGIKVGGTDPE